MDSLGGYAVQFLEVGGQTLSNLEWRPLGSLIGAFGGRQPASKWATQIPVI